MGKPGVVAPAFAAGTVEAEAGWSLVQGQPGAYSETLPQNNVIGRKEKRLKSETMKESDIWKQ